MIYIDIKNLVGRGNETILPVTADKAIIMTSDNNNRLDVSYQALTSRINTVETSLIKNPPTGAILAYAGNTAPTGWLLCNGANISRTTYAALFAILGTTYGAGDGSTTFALPDMRGRVGVGIGASGVNTLGQTGGEQTHVLTVAEMPQHSHEQLYNNSGSGSGTLYASSQNALQFPAQTYAPANVRTAAEGGGDAHNNMQPYIGINYIIKT